MESEPGPSAAPGGRRRLWRVIQVVFVLAVLAGIAVAIYRQAGDIRTRLAEVDPRWAPIALSGFIVLASYGVLIQTWRAVVGAWEARIGFWDAARIWSVSNLGRYVPGKLWQIGAMAAMARERGASPVASIGSALVVNIVNVITGGLVVLATGARVLDVLHPGARQNAILLVALLGLSFLLLPVLLPPAVSLAARVARLDAPIPRIPGRTLWMAALGTGVAWVLYGLAFEQLAAGVLGRAPGASAAYISVYTSSYLVGYLFLPAPAGVGVREWALKAGFVALGLGSDADAWVIAVASRLWLTVLEVLPGLLFIARDALRGRAQRH